MDVLGYFYYAYIYLCGRFTTFLIKLWRAEKEKKNLCPVSKTKKKKKKYKGNIKNN